MPDSPASGPPDSGPSAAALRAATRALAQAAGLDLADDRLDTLTPLLIRTLRGAVDPPRLALGETEPAFGLRLGRD